MRTCDACGKPLKGGTSMGGATVCRKCEPDVKAEINRLQAEGKPVSAIAIARSIFRETYSAGNYLLGTSGRSLDRRQAQGGGRRA